MNKVPCHYCGALILEETTAKITNGYCMPHEFRGFPFTEKIGGKFEVMSYHTQQQVDTLLPPEHKSAFEVIKSIMIAGDKLAAFTTTPVPDQKEFAKFGYAIIRDGNYFTGFVTKWAKNPAYHEDKETEVNLEEAKMYFGEAWEEVSNGLEEGDKFVLFRSSPFTWYCLAGREAIYVKRDGMIIFSKITAMN